MSFVEQPSQPMKPTLGTPLPPVQEHGNSPLHRLGEVRRQHSVSARTMAHRLRTTADTVRRQEDPKCDMMLSDLYQWQAALDVPVAELLIDPPIDLSPNVKFRAAMLKIMKTVRSLEQYVEKSPVRELVERLSTQLVELMPELAAVDSWPSVGKRRTLDDISPLEERSVPAELMDNTWSESTDQE